MKKLFTTILITMLAFTASTFAYADEVTVCPEESPASTIAAAQAAVKHEEYKAGAESSIAQLQQS